MLRVKNKGLIRRIAINSFKSNKLRNIFVIVAIILTTAMFSCLFTSVMSIADAMQQSTMKSVGTTAHGAIKYLSDEQYNAVKNVKGTKIKDISYSRVLSIATNPELVKRNYEIWYTEDKALSWGFSAPTVGRMPKEYREVAVDTNLLDDLGLPYTLGQDITLEYTLGKNIVKDTFTLTGYCHGDKLLGASPIYLSHDYVMEQVKKIPADENENIFGKITADIFFDNERDTKEKLADVIVKSGLDPETTEIGTNWAYNSFENIDLSTVLMVVLVCLLVCFCGYLIIYNIFYISVSRDIRFYGLLKSIGTTKKQIGTILRIQAILLAAIGIPLGCLVGYAAAFALVPTVNSMLTIPVNNISVNPLIFVFSAIFSILTLIVSVRKPAKVAGTVSPIEALRNTERSASKKKTQKIKNSGFKIRNMAVRNVLGNKKRTALVVTSLLLSLIIFNTTILIVEGFDKQKYIDKMMNGDFLIADSALFTYSLGNSANTLLTNEDLENIKKNTTIKSFAEMYFAEGLGKMNDTYYQNAKKAQQALHPDDTTYNERVDNDLYNMIENNQATYHVYGVNQEMFKYSKAVDDSTILDYNKLSSGNYVYVNTYDSDGKYPLYNVGDKIDIEGTEFEVIGLMLYDNSVSARHSHPVCLSLYMTDTNYKKLYPDRDFSLLAVADVEDSEVPAIEKYLAEYVDTTNEALSFESSSRFEEEFLSIQKTYQTVGTSLSAVLAFIGILNFINSILTSIISRLREFATMQSIGMTKKQLIKMLSCEGLTYSILTSLVMLTIGMAVSLLAVSVITANMFYTMRFNIIPLLICVLILVIVSLFLPAIAYNAVSKASIVERMRSAE